MNSANLRSLEEKWKKQNKTPMRKARLRYWYKNRDKLLGERRSLKRDTNGLVGV